MVERTVANGLTYGLGPASYDVRIAETIWMWPKGFRLASTIEYFEMPLDLSADAKDKSTWIRRGIQVHNTFIDPGWRGYLTLEITNNKWSFRRIKKGTPIAQIVFDRLEAPTEAPYKGKYQNQKAGVQKPIDYLGMSFE